MSGHLTRQSWCWVYIVRCRDGTYYTGSTHDLRGRVRLHNAGNGAKYIRGRGPVRVVYAKRYRDHQRALSAEWRVKQLSRAQKETLIRASARRLRKLENRLAVLSENTNRPSCC